MPGISELMRRIQSCIVCRADDLQKERGWGLLPTHPLLVDVDGCGQLGGFLDLPGRFLADVRVGLKRCHYDVVDFAGFPTCGGIKRIEDPLRTVLSALGD